MKPTCHIGIGIGDTLPTESVTLLSLIAIYTSKTMQKLFGKQKRGFSEMTEAGDAQTSPEMDLHHFNQEAYELEQQCDDVLEATREMIPLQRELEKASSESNAAAISRLLDAKSAQIMRQASVVNVGLRTMGTRNNALPYGDPTARIRINTHTKLVNRLMTTLNEYQQANRVHRDIMLDRFAKKYRTVNPMATDEDVAEAMHQQPDHFYSSQLLRSTRGERSAVALRDAQNQQKEVNRIEREVEQIGELQAELALLVEQQEETVNDIEQNVYRAEIAMERGGNRLSQAVRYARASRKVRMTNKLSPLL
ncbi:t-SNARE [Syncephalis plumigaleata]|nr:t-SNARE [Syncephalis plumigaleata]